MEDAGTVRWCHARADAALFEDVVQETLLARHASLHLYDPDRPLRPFLYGIMHFRGGAGCGGTSPLPSTGCRDHGDHLAARLRPAA
jgi:hypothetical protein